MPPNQPQPNPALLANAAAQAAQQQADIPETEIWRGSPSMKVIVYPGAVLAGIVIVAEIIFGTTIGVQHLIWRILAYAVAAAVLYGQFFLRQRFVVYRLTTKYLYREAGVLNKVGDQVDLRRYRDLTIRKSFWHRLVGCGNVDIISTDISHPDMVVREIASPDEVASKIRSAAEKRKTTIIDVE